MNVVLNGTSRDAGAARTVAELVGTLELPAQAILVEHNSTALRREEWTDTALGEGDRLEIIRIVAGG